MKKDSQTPDHSQHLLPEKKSLKRVQLQRCKDKKKKSSFPLDSSVAGSGHPCCSVSSCLACKLVQFSALRVDVGQLVDS